MSAFIAGLDLGQAHDYTALIVAERVDRGEEAAAYDVAHIDRIREARYPAIVAHTAAVVAALRERQPWPEPTLVVDYTGVGRPVADLLVEANLGVPLKLVTITGGETAALGERGEWRVPKRDLASVVQVLLQAGRLRIAASLPLARVLTEELINFRVKISLAGYDSYGAGADWREGNHDDLVLALALACWWGERHRPVPIVMPGSVSGNMLFGSRGRDVGFSFDEGRPGADPWAWVGRGSDAR